MESDVGVGTCYGGCDYMIDECNRTETGFDFCSGFGNGNGCENGVENCAVNESGGARGYGCDFSGDLRLVIPTCPRLTEVC
jgi:hypothetical protein